MATLNTLRTKGGWIVTFVIGIALLAFLIGDLAGGNSVFGTREKVGSIDGNKISYLDYAQEIDRITEIQTILNNGESLPAEMQEQIQNYAWEVMRNKIVLIPGLEKLGIEVTDDEMFDRMYGNNISSVLINSGIFTNPETGAFDKSVLLDFVSGYHLDPTGRMALLWQHLQDQVRQDAMIGKYLALVSGMPFVTDAAAETGAQRSNTLYNARYVVQKYSEIPDSLVKLTSSDVRNYYNAHKENYRQSASRGVEYVVFEVLPSAKDYADARDFVNEISAEFAASDNLQQYVTLNSQEAFNAVYYTREQLPSDLAEYAFNPNRTEIYGPMLEGNVYTTTRVSDTRTFPDTIGFRQMGFAPGTEALADSVFNVLKGGGDFETLALEYSLIPATATDAGRISTQGIPMEIGEQIYNTRDRLVKIDNPNGAMILEVYYRGPVSPKVQLAELVYHIEPSSATQQAAYAKASAFYTATAGLSDNFNKIVADSAYSKRVARIQSGQTQVSGLENAREMIRWAFNAKTGSISNIMEVDNNYVIATLVSAAEDGYAPVEQVQSQIAGELTRQKKFEMSAARMTGAASLGALAQSLSTEVGEVSGLNYNTIYIPDMAVMDPYLVGAVCGGVPEGKLSKPVQGLSGVYVVEITSSQVVEEQTTAEMERARLEAQAQYNLASRAYEAIAVKSKVIDGRAKYF